MIIWHEEEVKTWLKRLTLENLSLSLQSDGWRTPSKSKNKYLAFIERFNAYLSCLIESLMPLSNVIQHSLL